MALLKNGGKTFSEAKGELKTLAEYETGSMPSLGTLRRAWRGETHSNITGFPRFHRTRMQFGTYKKLIDKRREKKDKNPSYRINNQAAIEEALRLIIASKMAKAKGKKGMSIMDVARETNLKINVVRALATKKSWVPLYELIELEMMKA
jgi:hypothetical protein